MTTNLLANGNFHAGNTGFTSRYAYKTFISSDAQYTVTAADNINNINAFGDWTSITTDPKGGNGNVLVANGAAKKGVAVWSETVAVKPNTNYVFSFYGVDVNAQRGSDAVLSASIDGTVAPPLDTNGSWRRSSFEWNSGAHTSATVSIVDRNTSVPLNDFAIDDLAFHKAIGTDSGSHASLAASAADIWISDQSGHVGLFNTATGALIRGASTNLPLTDIAFIGSQMYGTSFQGLYKINDSTGASTLIGDYSVTNAMNALVGDGNHLLGASFTTNQIYSLPSQATVANVGHTSAGDLAFSGNTLYKSVRERDGLDGLYNVTAHKLVGTFKTGAGETFSDLYGLTNNGATTYAVAGNDIYSVNLTTARLTHLSNDAASGIGQASGAAFVNENIHT